MPTAYLLYLVPKTQPTPSSQAKIYGGYHVTLFPEQPLPKNYDLHKALKGFPQTKTKWTLPKEYKKRPLERQKLDLLYFADETVSKLMDWVSDQPKIGHGVWNEENRWEPLHVTLGSYKFHEPVSSDDLIDIFVNETEWYIQLVKITAKVDNPQSPEDVDWFWDPNQRVILYQKD